MYDEYGSPVLETADPPQTPKGQAPPPSPPRSPPGCGSLYSSVVPPAHAGYPSDACAPGASRAGFALAASHAAELHQALLASSKPPPSLDAGPSHADPLPAEWWVLRRFVRETCIVEPGALNAFIDLEDTLDPAQGASGRPGGGPGGGPGGEAAGAPPTGRGRVARGFRAPLYEWCRARQRGLPLPPLQGSSWAASLPEGVTFRDGLRVRHVLGLEWVPGWRRTQSLHWLLVEALDVMLHVLLLLLLPVAVAYYALDAQRQWAQLLCVPSLADVWVAPAAAASVVGATGAATPFSNAFGRGLSHVGPGGCAWWADFAPLPPKLNLLGGDSPLPIVAFAVCDALVLVLASGLRLLLGYLDLEGGQPPAYPPASSFASSSASSSGSGSYGSSPSAAASPPPRPSLASALSERFALLHGALLLFNLVLGFTAVGMVLAWHVLGGAVNPLAFLPDYAIVLSAVALVQSVCSSMFRASRSVREGLRAAFLRMMRPHLKLASEVAQFQLSLQRSAAVGKHLARGATWQAIDSGDAQAGMEAAAESEAAERAALLTGGAAAMVPPRAYLKGRQADDGHAGASAFGYGGRALQPIDIYLALAGDGRRPLLVEDFRTRFEALSLPLTTRQKEVLFSQIERARAAHRHRSADTAARRRAGAGAGAGAGRGGAVAVGAEGGVGGHDLFEAHPVVTAHQFAEAWEAMEQGLLRRGLSRAGVSAAQTMAAVGITLGALGVLLAFLAVGFRRGGALGADGATSGEFASVVRAVLVLTCAGFVAAARPRARGETDADGVVDEMIADDLARANEA